LDKPPYIGFRRASTLPNEYQYIRFSGDTLIGTEIFAKVWVATDEMQQNYVLQGFIRETPGKKVYFRALQDTVAGLLYDFDVEIGDTITIRQDILMLIVDDIDSVLVHDRYRKRISLSSNGMPGETWIEGIGSLCGVLSSGNWYMIGGIYELLCYFEKDTLKYSNANYSNCYYNNVGEYHFQDCGMEIKVIPNPLASSSLISFPAALGTDALLNVYSMHGVSVMKRRVISGNILIYKHDFAPGLYIFHIDSEAGQRFTGKFVVE
jgi:hypothetical protein